MKKILLLGTFLAGSLLLYKPADAQFRVHVNINTGPGWEHNEPYWHRGPGVVLINDRGYRNPRNGRDWDDRYWRRHNDRYNDRRHGDRCDDHHDRDHRHSDRREPGRGRW